MSTYNDILNAIKDSDQFILLSIDQHYLCTLWSRGLSNLTGKEEHAFLGKNIFQSFPELISSDHFENFKKCLTGQKIVQVFNHLSPLDIDFKGSFEVTYSPTYHKKDEEITGCLVRIKVLDQILPQEKQELNKYKTFSNNTDVGIWEIDTEGYTRFANPSMCKILGIKSTDDIKRKTYHSFFTKESLERITEEHEKRTRHISSNYEAEIIANNGEKRIVLINGAPLYNHSGTFIGLIGAFIDITEKKKIEAELINSEHRFRYLFEKSYRANAISRDFKILIANEAFAKIFGYSSIEEIMKIPVYELYTEESVQIIKKRISRIKEGKPVPSSYVSQGRRKDGSIFYLENDVTLIELSDGKAYFLSLKDITDKINARNALIASEAKFSGIFNSNLIGIAFSDDDHNIIDANERFLNIIQYSNEDLKTEKITWDKITPNDFKFDDEITSEEYAQDKWQAPYEREYVCKDGSKTPVLEGGAKLNGMLNLHVSFAIDITELRKSKEETYKLTKELSTFLYMTSHDLKGPLATIIGLTMIAKQDIKDSKALDYFKLIERSTRKLDNSLMGLLRIMQIKNNEFYYTEVDMGRLLNEVIHGSYAADFTYHAQFHLTIPDDLIITSDKEMLKTIFQKLIDNALKYTQPSQNPEVDICIYNFEKNIQIIFADRGKGINEKNIDKLFDMFYRGDVNSKGSGLGLYIVKSIVEKFNGKIKAANRIRGGAEFTIDLPKFR
ncbi:MAG: PAS domain-containing sensor histidine kinase [Sporocytophaga sp.]|uniref:PAS domain-containing sensor histidine kinase n=1 Tax=Sporocytophaga sp. TaxID=2231183 RepID=UPI001B2EFF9E|nr:PAS domain-containing sensor histidine kinase [Sporocytophaga sp.]MBO9699755.1 PAS domain-containing sensor histidine kinase [Sporocytophaga sp.]